MPFPVPHAEAAVKRAEAMGNEHSQCLHHCGSSSGLPQQASLEQRNAELEALVAEQQLLQREGSLNCSSPAVPDTMSAAVGAPAVEEPCSNGCADASWQDVTMQVPVCLQLKPAS
jgi:hypothetical protein